MKRLKELVFWVVMLSAWPLQAAIDPHEFSSPAEEQRYQDLIAELRCVVCQNQSLADSNAELAQDLRQQVYEMIKDGSNDKEIKEFLVSRYSDFVLYRPPLKPSTYLLWFGPLLLLIIGIAAVVVVIKHRNRESAATMIDPVDQNRIRQLLDEQEGENRLP